MGKVPRSCRSRPIWTRYGGDERPETARSLRGPLAVTPVPAAQASTKAEAEGHAKGLWLRLRSRYLEHLRILRRNVERLILFRSHQFLGTPWFYASVQDQLAQTRSDAAPGSGARREHFEGRTLIQTAGRLQDGLSRRSPRLLLGRSQTPCELSVRHHLTPARRARPAVRSTD